MNGPKPFGPPKEASPGGPQRWAFPVWIPADDLGPAALTVFDFSQSLVEIWRGSKSATKRETLECVTLNRTMSDVSLCLPKRKPFDFLAERPFLRFGRGDWIRTSDLLNPIQAL